jgi:hypothetical protein
MGLRKGMWVTFQGHVGIYIPVNEKVVLSGGMTEITTHEFHLVNDAGETVTVLRALTTDGMEQAGYDDIPEPRRPSADVAARLGYK